MKKRIKSVGLQDEKYQQVKEKLLQSGGDEEYHLTKENLIKFNGRIYVPNSDEMKRLIMKETHRKPYSSDRGYQKTLKTIKNYYYYSNLNKEVVDFVGRCI